ncbi:hypothetical protein CBOM_08064 [Ceraceosorus bombacis]|uniref:Uncharacterized protein n=1 Tax=Ceraceosorus bombacis TaxID=401625 RepID=A0A0P1BSP8_9BASI|nr:hypothetical protein CBOM_08064 [Ceraceosorus bombacis]
MGSTQSTTPCANEPAQHASIELMTPRVSFFRGQKPNRWHLRIREIFDQCERVEEELSDLVGGRSDDMGQIRM